MAGRHSDNERPYEPTDFRKALGWSYVMYGGQYVITTIITLILAAILGPSAFGVVAMAMVYVMFIQMLLRQGMVPAIIQRQGLQSSHLDSAFWLIVATAIVLTCAGLLLSEWWATVNRTPDLEPVIKVLSALIPIQSLIVVQEAVLNRDMNFRGLAVRTNSSALIGGGVGLVLAFTGFGVWALVAQHIVKSLSDVVVLWTLSDWRPRMHFSRSAARDLLGFSASASLAGFGTFVNNRSDALLIGLFFGPTAVGLYRLAGRFVDMVIDLTVRALQAVSLPELSRLQDDPKRFAERSVKIINSSALFALPAFGLLAGASDALIDLVGEEWAPAATPLKILCVVGAVRALTMFMGPMLSAIGRPQILALLTWSSALLSGGSFVLAGVLLVDAPIAHQVTGIAFARMAMFASVVLFLAVWLMLRNSEVSLRSLGRAVGPSTVAASVGFVLTQLLASVIGTGFGDLVRLIIIVVPSSILTGLILVRIEPLMRGLVVSATQRLRTGP